MPSRSPGIALAGAAARAADNPWNGTWVLDRAHPEPDGAAADYRFTITSDGHIRWEIPSLNEINTGTLDGAPMSIRRAGNSTGQTLSVRTEGARILNYQVRRDGKERGAGRMTLSADGRSWTDVPLDHDKPVNSLTMVYVKR